MSRELVVYRVSQQKSKVWNTLCRLEYFINSLDQKYFVKFLPEKKNCIADVRLAFSQGMQNMMRHFTFQEPPDLVTGNTFFP